MFKSIEEHAKLLGRSRQLANCRRQSTLYMCTANTVIYWLHVQVGLPVENSICDISVFLQFYVHLWQQNDFKSGEAHTPIHYYFPSSGDFFFHLYVPKILSSIKFCHCQLVCLQGKKHLHMNNQMQYRKQTCWHLTSTRHWYSVDCWMSQMC